MFWCAAPFKRMSLFVLQIFRGFAPMRYNKGVFGGAQLLKVAAAKMPFTEQSSSAS
jgi:hypothetical protein